MAPLGRRKRDGISHSHASSIKRRYSVALRESWLASDLEDVRTEIWRGAFYTYRNALSSTGVLCAPNFSPIDSTLR